LMSILYGFYKADKGEIFINGAKTEIPDSQAAIAAGIGMVFQHFKLVENFSVLENVILAQGEWLTALKGRFNAIVSNPPYVAASDQHLQQGDCRYEPVVALSPGGDGLAAFRQISDQAGEYLLPGGWLLFEHGYDQANQVQCILLAAGLENIKTHQDLAGIDRVTIGQWPVI